MTKERIFQALGLLEQAITIDRHYGPALSWAAICHLRLVFDGWADEPETSRSCWYGTAVVPAGTPERSAPSERPAAPHSGMGERGWPTGDKTANTAPGVFIAGRCRLTGSGFLGAQSSIIPSPTSEARLAGGVIRSQQAPGTHGHCQAGVRCFRYMLGPRVCGLSAGGKRIRTIGPALRKAVVPKREHPRAASRSLPGRPASDIGADERQAAIRS
jgi:hypothetical protein